MNEQISAIQTRDALELMRNLAPILNQKELFEFMLFSNRVVERYMPEHYNDRLSQEVTEMRKDKEWLKKEVSENVLQYPVYYDEQDELLKKMVSYHEVITLINQLDEPEVLSQKWVDENVVEGDFRGGQQFWYGRFIEEEKVRNLLIPKQDKPVIPQFVADWIERQKQPDWDYDKKEDALADSIHFTLYSLEANYPETNHDVVLRKPVNEWLNDDRKNYWKLIDGVRYGYEVEKEILWEIPMPDLKTTGGHIQYLTYDPKAKTYFASRRNAQLKQTFNAKDLASVPTQYRHYAELCDFKKI